MRMSGSDRYLKSGPGIFLLYRKAFLCQKFQQKLLCLKLLKTKLRVREQGASQLKNGIRPAVN